MKNILTAISGSLIAFATLVVSNTPVLAAPYPDGNLWGAAQVCGLPTNGLGYSNDQGFQFALQTALRSRQDCNQVARTVNSAGSQNRYNGSYPGQNSFLNRSFGSPNNQFQYGNPNYSQYGNQNYPGYPRSKNYHHNREFPH
jgi:hypothetical protein